MSYEQPSFSVGMYALDFDLSSIATGQYTAVTLGNATNATGTGMGRAALVKPAAGALILGIAQSNGRINESIAVMVDGISKAKISSSATAGVVGDLLATDATGMLVKATSGQYAVAVAHENYQPGDTTTVRLGTFGKV